MERSRSDLTPARRSVVLSAEELQVEDDILNEFESLELQSKQEQGQIQLQQQKDKASISLSLSQPPTPQPVEKSNALSLDNHQEGSSAPTCWQAQKLKPTTSKQASIFIASGRAGSYSSQMILEGIHQDSVPDCWETHQLKPASAQASLFVTNQEERATPQSGHMMLENITKADSFGIHSNSTALVEDERQLSEDDTVLFHHRISQILNWFRSVFSEINGNGYVTLKDLKLASKEYKASPSLLTL